MERLKAYRWPGNVRELENLVRRLAALYSQEVIGVDAIEAELAETRRPAPAAAPGNGERVSARAAERHLRDYFAAHKGGLPPAGLYDRVLREIERPLIQLTPRRDARQPAQGGAASRPQPQHAAQEDPRIGHRGRPRPKIVTSASSDIDDGGFAVVGRDGSRLGRKLALTLGVCGAAVGRRRRYAALRGVCRRSARAPHLDQLFLLLNLILVLPLIAIVAWRLVQVWAERRRGLAGSRLQYAPRACCSAWSR